MELSVPKTLSHDQKEGIAIASDEGEEINISTIYFMEGGRPEKSSQFEILLEEPLDLGKDYMVTVQGYREKVISLSGVFSTQAFEKEYHYDGELGALYEKEQTTFKLWSPVATNVTLHLFTKGNEGEQISETPMTLKDKGVWETVVEGDQNGIYYTYAVENKGES